MPKDDGGLAGPLQGPGWKQFSSIVSGIGNAMSGQGMRAKPQKAAPLGVDPSKMYANELATRTGASPKPKGKTMKPKDKKPKPTPFGKAPKTPMKKGAAPGGKMQKPGFPAKKKKKGKK